MSFWGHRPSRSLQQTALLRFPAFRRQHRLEDVAVEGDRSPQCFLKELAFFEELLDLCLSRRCADRVGLKPRSEAL